jgi:predicted O-methyltransferase YrrM
MVAVKEDRSHRSHEKNPRKWPCGPDSYDNPSKEKLWIRASKHAGLSIAEMMFLQDVPRLLGSGDYANLGHLKGGSAIMLANGLMENNLKGMVHTVDLFSQNGRQLKRAMRISELYSVRLRIEFHKGSTIEWAQKLEDKRFKFIFVDADHSYEAVKRDFYDWSFLLEKGGWISFHDTNQDFSHQALEETVVGKWDELKGFHVHRIRTFQKPS